MVLISSRFLIIIKCSARAWYVFMNIRKPPEPEQIAISRFLLFSLSYCLHIGDEYMPNHDAISMWLSNFYC